MPSFTRRAGVLLAFVAALALIVAPVTAQESKDARRKYTEIQKELSSKKKKLDQTRATEKTTLGDLDKTNRQLQSVRSKLKRYRAQRGSTEKQIHNVSAEIPQLKEKLERHRERMARKLRAMHRYGKYGDVALILGTSEDPTQLLRRWQYLEALARSERNSIEEYERDIEELVRKEAQLNDLRQELKAHEKSIDDLLGTLAKRKRQKQKILASVKKKKASYERMIKELDEASKRLMDIIKDSGSTKRIASKGFRKLKGRLPWPVGGRVVIPYGKQKDSTFKTPVFRNGVYIAPSGGAGTAKSVYSGRVVYADWFKGYGQLVIINHGGGYHTLYANLEEIFLSNGDIIDGRANIGRVGETSVIEKPSLYFEIRYKGKPLNPAQWLQKR